MASSFTQALVQQLQSHPPFAQMPVALVADWLADAVERYAEPGEVLIDPTHPAPQRLWWIRQGHVTGRRERPGAAPDVFELGPGDLLPVAALLAQRPVTATYAARDDCFYLEVPQERVHALAARSPVFADFLHQRVLSYLEVSRRRVHAELATQAQALQTLETPLGALPRRAPVMLAAGSSVREALTLMHERRVGSVLLSDADGALAGILTRYDVLGRVTLPGLPLEAPVSQVMSAPVVALDSSHTAQDAVLLMSRRSLRHVPVLEGGRVINVVSERDLFALQRLSIKHLGSAIRRATQLSEFKRAAEDIRDFTRHLLGQGVQARQLTALISHLNDLLTERLVEVELAASGLSPQHMCWMALGSEGRAEQTIATDQDNALVFESDDPERDRPQWLAFARRVNEALDAFGYPLCKGGVMASNPPCCCSLAEWEAQFLRWIEQGSAQDLLHASIFFDFRAVAGQAAWLEPLRQRVLQRAAATPRFIRQLAQNHAEHPVPLNWHGGVDGQREGEHLWLDLKLQATALLVDAARILALAQGLGATGTRDRLLLAGERLRVPVEERGAWATAFDYLQMQRLVRQLATDAGEQPNRIDLHTLNAVDQKVLKASLQAIKTLQQRLALDYLR